jgi:hypothetical protein
VGKRGLAGFDADSLFVDEPFVYFGNGDFSSWRSVVDMKYVGVDMDTTLFDTLEHSIYVTGRVRDCGADRQFSPCKVIVGTINQGASDTHRLGDGGSASRTISSAMSSDVSTDGAFSIHARISGDSYLFIAPRLGCLMRIYHVGKLVSDSRGH